MCRKEFVVHQPHTEKIIFKKRQIPIKHSCVNIAKSAKIVHEFITNKPIIVVIETKLEVPKECFTLFKL